MNDICNVKKEKCIGCGLCYSIDSTLFSFDDDGFAEFNFEQWKNLDVTITLKSCKIAKSICPTGAIELKGF